jgi:hypothetical protein
LKTGEDGAGAILIDHCQIVIAAALDVQVGTYVLNVDWLADVDFRPAELAS